MEILALISINIAFALGMYVFFSAKMTKTLKESQGVQLEKKIRSFYADFIHQSDQSIELLDSKLRGLRDLIQRAERLQSNLKEDSDVGSGISLQLQNLINNSKQVLNNTNNEFETKKEEIKQIPIPYPYMEPAPNKIALGIANAYTQNEPVVISKPDAPLEESSSLIASIGKRVKNIVIGSTFDETQNIFQNRPAPLIKQESNSNSIAYLVDGDPFADQESTRIRNLDDEKEKEEGSFLSTLTQVEEIRNPKPKDSITISPESVLKELPPSATKIDKVVFLLTKGYSHEEVADVMNLGYREVLLIETVKMDKSRRK